MTSVSVSERREATHQRKQQTDRAAFVCFNSANTSCHRARRSGLPVLVYASTGVPPLFKLRGGFRSGPLVEACVSTAPTDFACVESVCCHSVSVAGGGCGSNKETLPFMVLGTSTPHKLANCASDSALSVLNSTRPSNTCSPQCTSERRRTCTSCFRSRRRSCKASTRFEAPDGLLPRLSRSFPFRLPSTVSETQTEG